MPGRTGKRANPANVCKCGLIALYKKTEYTDPHGCTRHTREGCKCLTDRVEEIVQEALNELAPTITMLLGGKP